jgi:hypothetical protein
MPCVSSVECIYLTGLDFIHNCIYNSAYTYAKSTRVWVPYIACGPAGEGPLLPCTYMHTYTHTHRCTRAYIHTYIHTYIHAMHACMHAHIHSYTRIHICTYIHTYIHTCMKMSVNEGKDIAAHRSRAWHSLARHRRSMSEHMIAQRRKQEATHTLRRPYTDLMYVHISSQSLACTRPHSLYPKTPAQPVSAIEGSVNQSVRQLVSQPASQQARQPVSQSVSQPAIR